MGLFRKDKASEPSALRLPSLTPPELAHIGQAAYGSPPYGAIPSLVDPIVVEAYTTIGFATGTAEHDRLTEQLLDALERAGAMSAPWGIVGAFLVAKNFLTDDGLARPAYVRLGTAAVGFLRDQGVPGSALPPYMTTFLTG